MTALCTEATASSRGLSKAFLLLPRQSFRSPSAPKGCIASAFENLQAPKQTGYAILQFDSVKLFRKTLV